MDTVHVGQRCRMRPGPGEFSFPLVAEPWYTIEPPGFIVVGADVRLRRA